MRARQWFRLKIRVQMNWWIFLASIVGTYLLVVASFTVKGFPQWLAPTVIVGGLAIFLGRLVVNYRMRWARLTFMDGELELFSGRRRTIRSLDGAIADLGLHYVDASMRKIEGTVLYVRFRDCGQPLCILGRGVEYELGEYTAPETYGNQVRWIVFARGSPINFNFEHLRYILAQAGVETGASREAPAVEVLFQAGSSSALDAPRTFEATKVQGMGVWPILMWGGIGAMVAGAAIAAPESLAELAAVPLPLLTTAFLLLMVTTLLLARRPRLCKGQMVLYAGEVVFLVSERAQHRFMLDEISADTRSHLTMSKMTRGGHAGLETRSGPVLELRSLTQRALVLIDDPTVRWVSAPKPARHIHYIVDAEVGRCLVDFLNELIADALENVPGEETEGERGSVE